MQMLHTVDSFLKVQSIGVGPINYLFFWINYWPKLAKYLEYLVDFYGVLLNILKTYFSSFKKLIF
jgi:hypothetical protein